MSFVPLGRPVLRHAFKGLISSHGIHTSTVPRGFLSPRLDTRGRQTGLFGNPRLASAQGLLQFAKDSLFQAKRMDEDISLGKVPRMEWIKRLDVLSDTICKVVDMAAFVRVSHPQTAMVLAAQQAHELMFDFMNELNTSTRLYERVCEALDNEPNLSAEERRVGMILKHDFERSGIQFAADKRSEFVRISSRISVEGQNFLDKIRPAFTHLTFPSTSDLVGVNPILLKEYTTFTGKVQFPLDGSGVAEHILATAQNREAREKVWRALHSATQDQKERIRSILVDRARIAAIEGSPSFAAYELSDKVMQTPQNVLKFLETLSESSKALAQKEISDLGIKTPWDVAFAIAHRRTACRRRGGGHSLLSNYFSLANVFQGISDLCDKLYGLYFKPGTLHPGEVWDPDVRRLDVYQGTEKVGAIYCDLFSRAGKSPNPAHFTIQCSRRFWPFENTDGHQTPIIALVCDFSVLDGESLLSPEDVQTLFHEMGHAIHSMIGRTKLHNVAGTRCSTDFVELPSIIMEKFACDPQVLSLFAYHHRTQEPLPFDLFERYHKQSKFVQNWEMSQQVCLSFVDQALHGEAAMRPDFDPAREAYSVARRFAVLPESHENVYAHFGHLVSYGATYYSYLFDRCLSNMTWNHLFRADPLSREAGSKFRDSVLKWGGARPASECLVDLLGKFSFEDVARHIN